MKFHLRSLKARASEDGQKVTWRDVADGTGIRQLTLLRMAKNDVKCIRPEHIDALCAFFDCSVGDLMSAGPVQLPLKLVLRPDRRGKQIGEK